MQEPLISVIIPTYNRSSTLKSAVLSVLGQTHTNLELIVVDDRSEKPVAETLADISDIRLKIIRHDVNQGQAAARNTGAAHAKGNLLAFLDDDDLWKREKLTHQLDYMQQQKAGVSITDFTLSGPQALYNRHNSKENPAWLCISGCALALPSSMVIEKSIFEDVGRFDTDPAMRRIEDWDMAIKLQQHHHKLVIVPEFLTVYAGMHRTTPEEELKTLQNVRAKHAHTFPDGSKEAGTLDAGLSWKMARTELMAKHYAKGMVELTMTALRHPLDFVRYVKVVLEEPLREMIRHKHKSSDRGGPPSAGAIVTHGPS